MIREARNDDGSGVIALIGSCYAEYPGCVLDVETEVPELLTISESYHDRGGEMWVAETEGEIVGSVGFVPSKSGRGLELQKLYVLTEARRCGLGTRLCALVDDEARQRSADFIDLWSDTRFVEAHRLYERLGFVRGERTRELRDLSASVEYYFRKEHGKEQA